MRVQVYTITKAFFYFPYFFIHCKCSMFWSDNDISKTIDQPICSPEQIPKVTFDSSNVLFVNDTFVMLKNENSNSIRLRCEGKRGGIVLRQFYNDPSSKMTPYDRDGSTSYYDAVNIAYLDFKNVSTFQTTTAFSVFPAKFREFKSLALTCDYVNPAPCLVKDYLSFEVGEGTLDNTTVVRVKRVQKDTDHSSVMNKQAQELNDVVIYIYWIDSFSIEWICAQNGRPVQTNHAHECGVYPQCTFPYSNGRNVKPRFEILTDEQTCLSLGCNRVYVSKGQTRNIANIQSTLLNCFDNQWTPNWPFLTILPSLQLYDGLPKFYYSTSMDDIPLDEFVTVDPLPAVVHLLDNIHIIANTITEFSWLAKRFVYTNLNGSVVILPGVRSIPTQGFLNSFESNLIVNEDMQNMNSLGVLLSAWNGTQQVMKFQNVTFRKGLRSGGCTLQGPPQIIMKTDITPLSASKLTIVFDTQTILFDLICTHSQPVEWSYRNQTDVPIVIATPTGHGILSIKIYSLPKGTVLNFTCVSVFNPCDYTVAVMRPIPNGRSLLEIIPYFHNVSTTLSKSNEGDSTVNVLYYAIPVVVIVIILCVASITFLLRTRFTNQAQQSQSSEIALGHNASSSIENYMSTASLLDSNKKFTSPLDPSWLIPMKDLSIDKEKMLGEGQYGVVYGGNLKHNSASVPVAVKVMKVNSNRLSSAYKDSTLAEMNVLATVAIGTHTNIIRLFGAVTDNYTNGELMVVMEFCGKGCLQDLLRDSGDKVESILSDESNYFIEGAYVFGDLLRFSVQMASGMKYLESKKVIHGDLATRNLLVNQDNDLKISDFGLSKQLVNYDIYLKTSQCALPWRWMAPEALKRGCFSVKSDVWSFGVTLWEIFSYADIPFSGLTWTSDFVQNVEEGHFRLLKPKYSSIEIQTVMEECMNVHCEQRPTFEDVYGKMESIQSNWKNQ